MADRASPEAKAPAGDPAVDSWTGWKLDEVGGSSVGKVGGVYVDSESGAGVWLLAKLRRFGGSVLVPLADAVGAAGHVWIPYQQAIIKAAPAVGPSGELTREQELELCAHFGIPDGIGRAASVAPRTAGTITARAAV